MRENKTKDVIFELFAVAFIGTCGIFVRNSLLPPISTGMWRIIFAMPFLFLLALKNIKNINLKDFLLMLLSGAFLGADLIFFNISLLNTSIANTNLITNLTALIVVPFSFYFFKEKIPKLFLPGAIITILGVFILIFGKESPTQSNYKGDLLAGLCCIFYSGFFLTTYKLREKFKSTVIMFFGSIGSLLVLGITSILVEGIYYPKSMEEFMPLFLLAIFVQVCGQSLLAYCQGKISVNLSSIITLLQPVIASIYSLLLFGEKLSIMEMIGIVIVIFGIYFVKKQFN